MKYILYWWFYISPLGGGDLNGTVIITDTHVSSYMYDVGYIQWEIVDRQFSIDGNTFLHGEFILKSGNLNSVMKITERKVYHFIQGDEDSPSFYIIMKLKHTKKQKHGKEDRF